MEADTVPMRMLTPISSVLAGLHEEARLAKRTNMNKVDVQVSNETLGAGLLLGLQDYPKPGKAYLITLPTESGTTIQFEVEPREGYIFRVTFKTP